MTLLGLLLRFLLRAFGVIAHESERPVGPSARAEPTGLHHVGWPSTPAQVDRSFHHAPGETLGSEGGW